MQRDSRGLMRDRPARRVQKSDSPGYRVHFARMLNAPRRQQFLEEMTKAGWDLLLLYGHSWRKDFFRSLVNFNFFGPHAVAALTSNGDLSILVAHPWDQDPMAEGVDATIRCSSDFGRGLEQLLTGFPVSKVAIAGIELMEARFVDAVQRHTAAEPVSATALVERIRRFKTPEEIEILKAGRLAGRSRLSAFREHYRSGDGGIRTGRRSRSVPEDARRRGQLHAHRFRRNGSVSECDRRRNVAFGRATT